MSPKALNVVFVSAIIILIFIVVTNNTIQDNTTQTPPRVIRGKDSIVYKVDTIRDTVYRAVKAQKITDTVLVYRDTGTHKIDTMRCWKFSEVFPDSSKIAVDLCSKELQKKPDDLIANIQYIRPPFDSVRTVYRVDVHEVPIKERSIRRGLRVFLLGVACVGGGFVLGTINK